MPYVLRKIKDGYKVCLATNNKCFSKEPIPKARAERQMKAIKMHMGMEKEGGKLDEVEPGNSTSNKFISRLHRLKIDPTTYMNIVKQRAKSAGYDPDKLTFANDGIHKLVYNAENKAFKFGSAKLGDYIIWSFLERNREVEPGTAKKKREGYHARFNSGADFERVSPYNLALKILW